MSTENKQVAAALPATRPKGEVTYQVAGQDVRLNYQIVRDFLTKGNGQVSDQDLTQFISICKYNQLNPFLNEAYLVKFGQQPASMIVSKEAFFKRADANEDYEGIRAGIIIQRGKDVIEVEGSFKTKDDILLGGWAEVHRKGRKFPFISKVALNEYDKQQSLWKEKPSTMISKIAKVQALREAFPAQLGAMYTQEEADRTEDVAAEVVSSEIKAYANKKVFDFEESEQVKEEPKAQPKQPEPVEANANGELFNEGPGF
jgi:phage recombination protein Bet